MTHTQKSIVAGVDGSAGSRAAVRVAAELANALDNRLVLVHAVHDPPTFPYGDARMRELERGRAIRDGERLLRQRLATSDRRRDMPRDDRSSGCRRTLHRRHRSGRHDRLRVDGSEESSRALRVARRLGDRLDLGVVPVFVGPVDGWRDAPPVPLGVEVGDPVHELRERAARDTVRLLAVGSRGRGPVRQAFLGSVSAELAASAPCPVLVVPPTAMVVGDGDALVYDVATR